MANDSQNQQVRIPNLPIGQMTDKNGNATPSEMTFRQTLLTNLQNILGNEGLVMPTQSPANVTLIQNNSILNPATELPIYTCQLGTILYSQHPTDYTMDKVVIAVRNDNTYPNTPPIFKKVTLT